MSRELIKEAISLLEEGNYVCVVCACLGISQATWYHWIERAEKLIDGDKPHVEYTETDYLAIEFYESIKKAEANAEHTAVQALRKHFGNDFRAALNYLERRNPARWAKTAQRPIEDSDETPNLLKSMFQKIHDSFTRKKEK